MSWRRRTSARHASAPPPLRTDWPYLTITQTRGWEPRDLPRELFAEYAGVVAWARGQRLLPDKEAARLEGEASRRPEEAARALEESVATRTLLYRIFSGTAGGRSPSPADVGELNRRLAIALAHRRLEEEDGTWVWGWDWAGAAQDLDRVLWPVLLSAAELLTSDSCPG